MPGYTDIQARYFAEQLLLKRPAASLDGLVSTISGVKVDLNPHQVDAALFALKSPLSNGALLADEVGLGKTIEAGLVLAQYWCERKRHILLIVPASLRMQWRDELASKFYIDSLILETANYNQLKKKGVNNPFSSQTQVIICSYNFASNKELDLKRIDWDLVICDEAHRLRNVYKKSNVIGNKLKSALSGKKKLLLTATPLQNNLLELYGLTSIIDDHVFGDTKTFREMYVAPGNSEIRNLQLKKRLQPICQRTLRKQVTEYIRYTNRIAICQEYQPTPQEEKLYNDITEYLKTPHLYALPVSQRSLITLVLRKLLASSSYAIAGTLDSLVNRLENLLAGKPDDLEINDLDTVDEYSEAIEEDEEENGSFTMEDYIAIEEELKKLKEFRDLALSIKTNSKGENLLTALKKGFTKSAELGGARKAVIFTESRRTQDYLFNLLSNNGYEGKIVFLNGMNNDAVSKSIYADWKQRHKGDDSISGSRQADMKAAIVEEFKNNAEILIGTEAAAEGINLQFCNLLVNYDLPWNPQRIEQRIGRCHRYGQKNDVVVLNFLNNKNAADTRVYELLNEKFKLFSGVFGSSDEVLGSIESGVDFEKRISDILQKCKTTDEINAEFNQLQNELSDQIESKMISARKSILENFDEEVSRNLKTCEENTVSSIDTRSQWLYYFLQSQSGAGVTDMDGRRFSVNSQIFNLDWRQAEANDEAFLRVEDPVIKSQLEKVINTNPVTGNLVFDYSNGSSHKIGFFTNHPGLTGTINISKLTYFGLEPEEHLIVTAIADNGEELDSDLVNKLFQLPATQMIDNSLSFDNLSSQILENAQHKKKEIEEHYREYFLKECEKLDQYSEDLKEGLQADLKALDKEIREKKKAFKANISASLDEMLKEQEDINKLEKKKKRMRRELYDKEDEIDVANDALQNEIKEKLKGESELRDVLNVSFKIE